MRSNSEQQHKFNSNNQDIKNKILRLIEQHDDQFTLHEMFQKLNQIASQRRGTSMELNPVSSRYKKVLKNEDREQWALDWLY